MAVAETEHAIAATRRNDRRQAADVGPALVVIENVKESAVEHRLEPLIQIDEAESIGHHESRLEAPLGRLRHGRLNGLRREVDAQNFMAE